MRYFYFVCLTGTVKMSEWPSCRHILYFNLIPLSISLLREQDCAISNLRVSTSEVRDAIPNFWKCVIGPAESSD